MQVTSRGPLGEPPPLGSASMGGIPPFASGAKFRFDPKVNVLIGPNGVGKSVALGIFAGERQERLARVSDEASGRAEPTVKLSDNIEDVSRVFVGATRASLTPEMAMQDLRLQDIQGMLASAINSARWVLLPVSLGFLCYLVTITALSIFLEQPPQWSVISRRDSLVLISSVVGLNFAYLLASYLRRSLFVLRLMPGNRLLSETSAHYSEVSSIFMFQAVASINRRLLGVGAQINKDRRSVVAQEAARVALECAKAIAPEVFPASAELRSGTVISAEGSALSPWMRLRHRWLRLRWRWYFTDHLAIVDIRGSEHPLHITSLSSGTQGTLLIAWYLALSLVYAHGFKDGWRERPAVLFIDEIENHLHPAWQRRFIPVFLDQFPNLQITATTHSPFAVAGLKVGQVHKLSQASLGKTEVETNKYDIVGYTADEILHEYFGVQDPTDLETAQAVEVLRWLRESGSLEDEGMAEDWRVATIEELGAPVEKDFAAHEDATVARWLAGEIESPVPIRPPLMGTAEAWRQATIGGFESLIGVDVLSGGPMARQRQLWMEQMANGTFRPSWNTSNSQVEES